VLDIDASLADVAVPAQEPVHVVGDVSGERWMAPPSPDSKVMADWAMILGILLALVGFGIAGLAWLSSGPLALMTLLGLGLALGGVVLVGLGRWWWRPAARAWVCLDDEGVTFSGRPTVRWSDVAGFQVTRRVEQSLVPNRYSLHGPTVDVTHVELRVLLTTGEAVGLWQERGVGKPVDASRLIWMAERMHDMWAARHQSQDGELDPELRDLMRTARERA